MEPQYMSQSIVKGGWEERGGGGLFYRGRFLEAGPARPFTIFSFQLIPLPEIIFL